MAAVANNVLTRGFRGKFGNAMIFKTMRGKAFVSAVARKPEKKKESDAQRKTRSTFREATFWAQNILLDEDKKKYYSQRAKALKLPNAYTAAITDYMRKAKITAVQGNNNVYCAVRKPGFSLKQVSVDVQSAELPKSNVTVRQKSTQWKILVVKPNLRTLYTIKLTIVDDFGRETIQEIEV